MGFSKKIKEDIFVKSARHCCVCHNAVGLNIEVHHIKPQKQGGKDTFENAIALCFNCHSDAGHYFAGHPKGAKLSPTELIKHRDAWFKIVETNNIIPPQEKIIELIFNEGNHKNIFKPIFIKETTRYIDKKSFSRIYEITGKDPMDFVNERKKENKWNSPFYIPGLNNVENLDDYLDLISNNDYEFEDEEKYTNCQPVIHRLDGLRFSKYKEINHSNCTLNINIKNISINVLEDFKMYLTFENVIEVDSVNKQQEFLDTYKYSYNVKFIEEFKAEYIPTNKTLVQNDSSRIDTICFRVKHTEKKIKLKWELFARNVQENGFVEFQIDPQFEEEERTKYVSKEDVKEPTIRILPKFSFA